MAERYEDQYRDRDRGRRDDRGFMERAGDEVRSWFGDDDAERRRQMDDRDRDRDRFRDQLYGQSSDYRRGYGERGSENRGSGDRSYEDRGFSDRGYGYGSGAGDRSWGQQNYRGQEGYRGGQGYGSDDRSDYSRSRSFGTGSRNDFGGPFGFGEGRRDTNYSGRGPKGYQRSDPRINEDVCDRLCDASDIDASNIEVSVTQGEVTLTGSVNDRETKRRAEDLVERISGVREVHNNLRVNRGQDTGSGSGSVTGTTSAGSIGASGSGGDVAHPGITGGGPSGATNISSTGNVTGGAAGAPENPLGLRENTETNTRTSTAGGRR